MKKFLVMTAVAALFLGGCANRGDTVEEPIEEDPPARAAHKGPVCMLECWLPTESKYEEIEEVYTKKWFYGGVDGQVAYLADMARELGANVVHKMKTGHSVGLIAWAAPYAMGDAVHMQDMTDELCEKLKGSLR